MSGAPFHLDAAPSSIPSAIAAAVLREQRTDPALVEIFGTSPPDDEGAGAIFAAEAEDLFEATTLQAPSLATVLAGWQEIGEATDGAYLRTTVSIILLTRPQSSRGTTAWLRARILDRVIARLWRYQGVLTSDGEAPGPTNRLTEAILENKAVVMAVPLKASNLLATPMPVTFHSVINRRTREFLP